MFSRLSHHPRKVMVNVRTTHSLPGSMLVRDILKTKERGKWTVDENTTVFEGTRRMVDENVGSLVVTRKGKPVGIVTERDYLRKVVHCGKSSSSLRIADIATMDEKVILASLDDSIQDCVDAMGSKEIRHLPCFDPANGEIVGLLSITEVARALGRERERVFRKLDAISNTIPIHDG